MYLKLVSPCRILSTRIQQYKWYRKNLPWYNPAVRDAKWLRMTLKRHLMKTSSCSDWGAYRYQMVWDELARAKSEYYHNKLSEADNHKDVYSIAYDLMFCPTVQKLATHDSVQDLSEQFADNFIEKIITIDSG